MIRTDAIKLTICLFFIFSLSNKQVYSQEIKKENLYILFKKNDGAYDIALGKKFTNENGINFNLYEIYFTHYNEMKKDTLCIDMLEKYHLTNENDIEKKANMWRKKNEKELKRKYGVLYRQAMEYKNNIFNTYIIEKINSKQIVVYEVKFRNEGAVK